MGQFNKVLLAIDSAHTVSQKALDCRLGLYRLNQGYGPNRPTHNGKFAMKQHIYTHLTETIFWLQPKTNDVTLTMFWSRQPTGLREDDCSIWANQA